jgi:spore germination cell wall hydrolase CwlJ-like protein
MQFKFPRAGALAQAALLFASLVGAGPSAAWAQETAPEAVAAPVAESGLSGLANILEGIEPPHPVAVAEQALEERVRQATSLQELVGDMPVEDELSADMKCLAQAVYFESRGEPLAGQLAVAEVVINRSKSGYYPSDYCSVITQRAQFSFVRRGVIPQADESSPAWRRAKAIAQIAQQDLWASDARDALYFHATYVHPTWARQKTQLAQIDTHIFYR